jgi:hypothetical protein
MVENVGIDNQCIAFDFEKKSVALHVKLSFSHM